MSHTNEGVEREVRGVWGCIDGFLRSRVHESQTEMSPLGVPRPPDPSGKSGSKEAAPRGHRGRALGKRQLSWHRLRAPVLWEVATQGPIGLSRRTVPGGQHSGPSGDRGFSVLHVDSRG